MVTDPPQRLVTVIVLALVVYSTLATVIPKLRPVSEDAETDVEEEEEESGPGTSGPDQQSMVLKAGNTDREEPVFIEFSYVDENERRVKNDDPSRDSYNIIDAPKANAPKLIPVVREDDDAESPIIVKVTEENQNPTEESEESVADSILQWHLRRQTEIEVNVPGFHNWPKHIPDHLRPISPFPEQEEPVIAKGPGFVSERETKKDEAFLPSEKLQPPPRAGPYLYPQSVVDREFRVPFY